MQNNFLILVFLLLTSSTYATKIIVNEKGAQRAIANAVTLAQPFDTIIVNPGLYKEHSIIINKPLTLLGESLPTISAEGEAQDILIVTANDVHISGFILQNIGVSYLKEVSAIRIKKSKNGSINSNIIRDCYFGIYLEHAKEYIIRDNKVEGTIINEASAGNAIHIWKGSKITITNNEVRGHRDGIYFEFVDSSRIVNNKSISNIRYGLHFMFSNNDEYIHNEFRDNGAGVAVMFSKKISMKYNEFAENWGGASYGLLLKEISDGEIINNRFYKNTIGILAEGANRLKVDGNQFVLNGTALDMKGNTLESRIERNNFIANTFEVVTNSQYSNNLYNQNYWSGYEGYDLNRDGTGDVAYRPINVYSKVTEEIPAATIMLHSFIINLLDIAERLFPTIIPAELIDTQPRMRPWKYDNY